MALISLYLRWFSPNASCAPPAAQNRSSCYIYIYIYLYICNVVVPDHVWSLTPPPPPLSLHRSPCTEDAPPLTCRRWAPGRDGRSSVSIARQGISVRLQHTRRLLPSSSLCVCVSVRVRVCDRSAYGGVWGGRQASSIASRGFGRAQRRGSCCREDALRSVHPEWRLWDIGQYGRFTWCLPSRGGGSQHLRGTGGCQARDTTQEQHYQGEPGSWSPPPPPCICN